MRNTSLVFALTLVFIGLGCRKEDAAISVLNNPADGQIVVSTYNTPLTNASQLLIMDKKGKTVWQKTVPVAAINFRKWQVNGTTRYSYMEFDANTPQLSQGILPTTAVLLNESFAEIKRVRLLPYNGRSASGATATDAHEFIYLGDNHFITLNYFEKAVNNIPAALNPVAGCKVVAPIIQEINNGEVTWEWDGTNYPELYTQSVEGNVFSNANLVHDYVHMNSIFIDPTDNNLICSMRNLNQVIKISHTDGHIMWRLGGANSDFAMTPEMKFLRQHHATLADNNKTLLLYDNGELAERPNTRVVEFQLDEAAKTIRSFKPFTLPDNIFSQYMGSVQKRGETYFIGCGSVPKILEINYLTRNITFMMNLPNNSYRALKD